MRHQASRNFIVLLLCALAATAVQAAEQTPPTEPAAPPAEVAAPAASAEGPYIAGLAPYQRPAGAPVITEFSPSEGWRVQMLHGVAEPVPPHLGVEDQGAWYTPFNHPGMTGPYDLRQWHQIHP